MKLIPPVLLPAWVAGLKVITTRCEGCHKSLALRQFAARKAGIHMHGFWYCSSRCFTAAAEKQISRLLTSGSEQAMHVPRMPLGLNLISHGLLTIEQLKKATDEQKETGGEIGDLLVRQGSVNEKQITAIRAAEWGCPVFAVPKQVIQTGIVIPSTLIHLFSMIPLHYVAATNLLLVGFVHCIEYGLLYTIEQMTGCTTTPCFVTPGDFAIQMEKREQVKKQPADIPGRELVFEDPKTPAEMASILCSSSLEIEADEALIGKCNHYLWVRLKTGSEAIDILFKAG